MSAVSLASESVAAGSPDALAPRIQRLKHRLLTADYEICMARARYYTEVYRETDGLAPALRAARALERTLEKQRIFIYPDEHLVGNKTVRFLSTPLSVERGDFLRSLQLELDILERKQKPFLISDEDAAFFRNQVLPYWDGRTLHDAKSRKWAAEGIVATKPGAFEFVRRWRDAARFVRYVGQENLRKILGANFDAPVSDPNSPLSRSCRLTTSSSRWVPRCRAAFCRMARSLVGLTGFSMKS